MERQHDLVVPKEKTTELGEEALEGLARRGRECGYRLFHSEVLAFLSGGPCKRASSKLPKTSSMIEAH